jgi:putative endonuclease
MPRSPVVYLLASRSRALYVGVTTDLPRRLAEHRAGAGHTGRYRIDRLVYAEPHDRIVDAIAREKQIKGWRREKKVARIEASNPTWRDLSWGVYPDASPSETRRDPSTGSG